MKTSFVDAALIKACLANRRQAQRRLYELSLPTLTFIAKRYLHHQEELFDVLQEVYLSVFKHLDQFDSERASFNTWSGRITINACLKRNRATTKDFTSALSPEHLNSPCGEPGPLARLTDEELVTWLKEMPPDFYLVFNLHAVEGYEHAEIARLLQITPELSRQRLRRARTWLQRAIAANPEHPLRDSARFRHGTLIAPLFIVLQTFLQA